MIIKVGVAYGSDVALVRKLLMQIAQNNPAYSRTRNRWCSS
ncbi:hypothetical protein ULG90_22990 [Halopseudomonas pachastrellae]|nr:hypothetical protein ULG90_22990 [Halopseudomonas pachastrellae]